MVKTCVTNNKICVKISKKCIKSGLIYNLFTKITRIVF